MTILTSAATTIAVLALGYFILYRRSLRPLKKQYEKLTEMQAKLLGLFSDFEDMMDGFEEYVEELRAQFKSEKEALLKEARESGRGEEYTETLRRDFELMALQAKRDAEAMHADMLSAQRVWEELMQEKSKADPMKAAFKPAPEIVPIPQPAPRPRTHWTNERHERVLSLSQEGHNPARIAQLTGFSKGEIELILEMHP